MREGRQKGPYGNATIMYVSNSVAGPLYDAAVSLQGPPYTSSITRLVVVDWAVEEYDSSRYCPFDTHSASHDFYQGIMGAGLGGDEVGKGTTDWVTDYFTQHPAESRELTYQLCPLDAGRLWLGPVRWRRDVRLYPRRVLRSPSMGHPGVRPHLQRQRQQRPCAPRVDGGLRDLRQRWAVRGLRRRGHGAPLLMIPDPI